MGKEISGKRDKGKKRKDKRQKTEDIRQKRKVTDKAKNLKTDIEGVQITKDKYIIYDK